jgi:cation diffusion facilitator family transporter
MMRMDDARSPGAFPDSAPLLWGHDPRHVAMAASLGTAVLMLVGKMAAYWLTGSTAIFSDALESVIHIAATGMAAYSLWFTTQPADRDHPYGHGKFAYFSAGFEGALILIASVMIIYVAVKALILGPELRQLDLGVGITFVLAMVNLALGLFLVATGRRTNTLVLEANGKHVLTDMWTSLGVVVGVTLVYFTHLTWLDPVVAILAASNIVFSGGGLLGQAFQGLMEKADQRDSAVLVCGLEQAVTEGLIGGFHQLRHRRVNDQVYVDAHLLLPGRLSLEEAHHRASEVEARMAALFPEDRVWMTSHLEPEEHEAVHPGGHAEFPDPFQ